MRTTMSLWFDKLEAECWSIYGLGVHGLPQFDWSRCYKSGMKVKDTVREFARVYPTYSRLYGRGYVKG